MRAQSVRKAQYQTHELSEEQINFLTKHSSMHKLILKNTREFDVQLYRKYSVPQKTDVRVLDKIKRLIPLPMTNAAKNWEDKLREAMVEESPEKDES